MNRSRTHGSRPAGNGPVHGHGMTGAIEGLVEGRKPGPRTEVSEADVHAPGAKVSGHKPPEVGVEVPAWWHENVVHAFDDAVPVHPDIVPVAVGPIPVHPNSIRTNRNGLRDDRLRRWGRRFGNREGLRLLNHDNCLAIDLLGLTTRRVDDRVVGRSDRLALFAFTRIAIPSDVRLVGAARTVSVGPREVRGDRLGDRHRRA